jgi:hypothetical protein
MKQLSLLLLTSVLFTATANAKFAGALPEATDFPVIISEAFKRLTGNDKVGASVPNSCKQLVEENKTVLGDVDPISGFSYANQLNSPFWKWYFGCIESYLKNDVKNNLASIINATGPVGAEVIGQKNLEDLKSLLWKSLTEDQKKAIATSVLQKVVSFEIITEFGKNPEKIVNTELVKRADEYNQGQSNLIDAVAVLITISMKQKEFLVD